MKSLIRLYRIKIRRYFRILGMAVMGKPSSSYSKCDFRDCAVNLDKYSEFHDCTFWNSDVRSQL